MKDDCYVSVIYHCMLPTEDPLATMCMPQAGGYLEWEDRMPEPN